MNRLVIKVIAIILSMALMSQMVFGASLSVDKVITSYEKEKSLTDWEAFALGVNGKRIPDSYFTALTKEVKAKKGNYKLVTDYARICVVLRVSGKDPTNFAGYNFLEKIYNFENMQKQGTNAPIWALIALQSYKTPKDAKINQKQLIQNVLSAQKKDGGFSLSADGETEVDLTAMALMALAPYQKDENVKKAIDRAVTYLAKQQLQTGEFSVKGKENSESISQVIIGLTSVGISTKDKRFIKNSKNLMDILATYQVEQGQFEHMKGKGVDRFATSQAVLAYAANQKLANKKGSIYQF